MKKLLIAMTAAAVGTCAWADGEAEGGSESTTTTYFNEQFTNWQNGEGGYVTSVAAPWSYGTVTVDEGENATLVPAAPAADELKVVNGALALNTGFKVLRGAFATESIAIPDNNLFFNATVAFKDPSDTLPTLTGSDKFAIVALDNIESLEAGLTNVNTKAATNLWVIAHHKTEGKRAYRLTGNLDSKWFKDDEGNDVSHTIVVKAYSNVVGTRAGFLVMLDNQICKVLDSYAISSGNVIDFKTAVDGSSTYLGYASTEVSLSERYGKGHLLLSLVSNSSLSSVDFQGQGVIDELSLADAGADFGPDVTSKTVTFTGYDSTGIVSISPNLVNGVYTITNGTANGDITFAVTLESDDYRLTATNATVAGTSPNYTVTYAYNGADTHTIELDVFKPAASVGDTEYKTFSAALAAAIAGSGKLKLASDVKAADLAEGFINIESGTIEIDLNGKEIVDIVNNGNLTIKDSVGTGVVLAAATDDAYSVDNTGTLTILGGCFNGGINGATAKGIFGGKFKVKPDVSALNDGLTFSEKDDNDYYSVVPASNYPESDKLVDNGGDELTDDEKAAVKATFDDIAGESADKDAAVKSYINTVYGNSVPADALIGANNVDISVKFSLPLMQEDPAVKIVAEAAEAGEAAAFTFQIKEGDAGDAVAIKAALAKVYEMIRYSADLNGLDAGVVDANNGNVECTISADKKSVKVSFKSGEGKPSKGFMKVKLR